MLSFSAPNLQRGNDTIDGGCGVGLGCRDSVIVLVVSFICFYPLMICLSVRPSLCLSVCLSVCLSALLPVCLSVYPSVVSVVSVSSVCSHVCVFVVRFVPQDDVMLRELTVRENIDFSARYRCLYTIRMCHSLGGCSSTRVCECLSLCV